MRLYKSPRSPYLQADVIHPATKRRVRISTGETTKGAASQAALCRIQEWSKQAEAASSDGRAAIALNTAVEAYRDSLQAANKASAPLVAGIVKRLLGGSEGRWGFDGSRWLHDLTPQDLADLSQARSAEGSGPQTIAHELKVLRAATLRAGSLRYRVPEITDWALPAVSSKTRYLSVAEFKAVYDYLDPDKLVEATSRAGEPAEPYSLTGSRRAARQDIQDLLVCLAMTGGRWQEIARLTWAQVDLPARTITIYAGKTEAERLVPMPEMLCKVLTRRHAAPHIAQDPVFPGAEGSFRSVNACAPILRAMSAVGLNTPEVVRRHGKATVHSLRHTFASLLLQSGADLAEVQDALGHATLHMTRRYAHLAKRKSIARLGSILDAINT